MKIHVNELHLEGDDNWTQQFNLCSEYYQKWNDESLSKEEQDKYGKLWFEERQRLELGIW